MATKRCPGCEREISLSHFSNHLSQTTNRRCVDAHLRQIHEVLPGVFSNNTVASHDDDDSMEDGCAADEGEDLDLDMHGQFLDEDVGVGGKIDFDVDEEMEEAGGDKSIDVDDDESGEEDDDDDIDYEDERPLEAPAASHSRLKAHTSHMQAEQQAPPPTSDGGCKNVEESLRQQVYVEHFPSSRAVLHQPSLVHGLGKILLISAPVA
ncbi:hypothetical protein BXZ70DRAFT_1049731 [Cristinia sonorae]|uniref:Uncharacterized protein n=1 Tax=Cristinia sonorae TaxID=1940300 RepID=A0A8K0XKM4_9AGAR|nr:hypothetical protein BXZ70DRAFT_1049731 [Cristinia sonorae]